MATWLLPSQNWAQTGRLETLININRQRKVFSEKYVSARIEIGLSGDTKYGEFEEYLLGELFKRNWTIFVLLNDARHEN